MANDFKQTLWKTADKLRAQMDAAEYKHIVLGLIFLKYISDTFVKQQEKVKRTVSDPSSELFVSEDPAEYAEELEERDYYIQDNVFWVPQEARWETLRSKAKQPDIGSLVDGAMTAIENENTSLRGKLDKRFGRAQLGQGILGELIDLISTIGFADKYDSSDLLGEVYEYFLGQFASAEGKKGGQFYTPSHVVKTLVAVLSPNSGRVYDPCCGSGGMFVQSMKFIENHKGNKKDVSVYGQEYTGATYKLAKMNLAIRGISANLGAAAKDTFANDQHETLKADFIMANPPFNVNEIQKDRLEGDKHRFPYGMPRNDNGNYLWIQMFYSALNQKGRAGFVMANSASDARGSEQEIRQKLIEEDGVDVMVAVSSNFFYTVTLPCALWFLDKNKPAHNKDKVLFIDARHIFRQVTRAVRDYTSEQLNFIANIVRLYRGQDIDNTYLETHPDQGNDGKFKLEDVFTNDNGELAYQDIAGLCKVATKEEILEQGYSLNPGRYVGVAEGEKECDEDFSVKLTALQEELEVLNAEAHELEASISENLVKVLGAA